MSSSMNAQQRARLRLWLETFLDSGSRKEARAAVDEFEGRRTEQDVKSYREGKRRTHGHYQQRASRIDKSRRRRK